MRSLRAVSLCVVAWHWLTLLLHTSLMAAAAVHGVLVVCCCLGVAGHWANSHRLLMEGYASLSGASLVSWQCILVACAAGVVLSTYALVPSFHETC